MISEFKITYSWRKRVEPLEFSTEYYEGASLLDVGLGYFTSVYEGVFALHFDNLSLDLDLNPDLTIIFFDIPAVLEKLVGGDGKPLDLYFCEQGTGMRLLLQAAGDAVTVKLEKTENSRFLYVPDGSLVSVSLGRFVAEWIRFTTAVLDAVKTLQPELETDESYQEYRMQLLRVESMLRH